MSILLYRTEQLYNDYYIVIVLMLQWIFISQKKHWRIETWQLSSAQSLSGFTVADDEISKSQQWIMEEKSKMI